ncbi:hypothetical protein BDV23DRAFT_187560 [Aspergillus alliaceus]|uniref:NmrA-like domain-containing protein n=1 Tax=Petromyces alliaceus TaxID=209559 RepID=A0A5N7BWH4_PETAA|nr:hypothetical protein BDV23DRAFT_187560 [Aspergillus alliaceus]
MQLIFAGRSHCWSTFEAANRRFQRRKLLRQVVAGCNFIFAITNFFVTQDADREYQQGRAIAEVVLTAALETLEVFIWSSLRILANGQFPITICTISTVKLKSQTSSSLPLYRILYTEVWLSAFYQNYLHLPTVYGLQKTSPGRYCLIYPVNPGTKMPFTWVRDLGRLVLKIMEDPARFHAKTVSLVSEFISPMDQLGIWKKEVSVQAQFESLSKEAYEKRPIDVHGYDPKFALTMAENMTRVEVGALNG